ncbi:tetratricopeptide repeat protein [Chitinimonas viridis]|uniref:protein O-GlcNAc transferase n=1 Tax=Chitinimonas viridis TaxID=664880 RepID=A0ABT8BBI3_9NEIS|nr:tetratricopeptide repeat protein [Chitinimonas viridis]MDN3578956.1 tetratricopeptide repeat protein [Chitinimonas viridis]
MNQAWAAILRKLGVHSGVLAAGRRLLAAERYEAAEIYLQLASRMAPKHAATWLALGTCLQCRHCNVAAMAALETALELAPDLEEAEQRLGHAAIEAARWPEAIARFTALLARHPGSAEYHYHLGNAHAGAGQLHEAVEHYRSALAIEEVASSHNGLGLVLSELGRQAESLPHFRRAAELSDKPTYLSNLLFTLCYDDTLNPGALYQAHLQQAARLPAEQVRRWKQDWRPERKLRVGYVSPDMRHHPVAYFVEPVFREHDRKQFDVYVYSTQRQLASDTTTRLSGLADYWREFDDAEAEAVAEAILADRIDILVDLAGHTGNNSLVLMARRLAPVQVTWLGYLNTTGLATMDYRLTDAVACPPQYAQALHSEQLAYLPDSQWCYQPPADAPEVVTMPCLVGQGITFGALHNPAKIGPAVIRLWADLLLAVPDSRLLIAARGFARIADETRARFAALGVAPERIVIRDRAPFHDYLAMHGQIDINLDTFPYTGGTTTCHSLWMGVPVLTLACDTVMGRGGASALNAVGLSDWIADSGDAFVQRALAQLQDRAALNQLRLGLRERMARSPLMDGPRFTRALEQQYRAMWQRRCEQEQAI